MELSTTTTTTEHPIVNLSKVATWLVANLVFYSEQDRNNFTFGVRNISQLVDKLKRLGYPTQLLLVNETELVAEKGSGFCAWLSANFGSGSSALEIVCIIIFFILVGGIWLLFEQKKRKSGKAKPLLVSELKELVTNKCCGSNESNEHNTDRSNSQEQ
jgi:hypothetical protein